MLVHVKLVLLPVKALLLNLLIFWIIFTTVQFDLNIVKFLFWFLKWWETRLQKVKCDDSFFENYTQSIWKAKDMET